MTRVDRFAGGLAASVALAGVGLLSNADGLLVAATVPLVYVVYGSLTGVSVDPEDLEVERRVDPTGAFPGDRVSVSLTVRNEGEDPLPDLRVVDGVPDALPVVDGSPRGAFSLRPGEAETVEYVVVANRGDHAFDPATVRARSLSASDVATIEVDPDGDDAVACTPAVDDVPLQVRATRFAGRVRTDSGGSGVEFHATREYQHGDPVSRIDWRRLAKGQDLSTVDYREHRAARVVLVVDARDPCHVAPRAGVPTGAAMCAYGATRAATALLAAGHEVGLAAFGVDDGDVGPAWVDPGRRSALRLRLRETLDRAADGPDAVRSDVVDGSAEEAEDAAADGVTDPVAILGERLPPDAQVLFFTPGVDSFPRSVVRRLRAYGHDVTVVSPDPTHEGTAGGQLRTVERTLLLDDLRESGARTVDWARDRPLALVLSTALREVIG